MASSPQLSSKPVRRNQEDRSEATRRKLIDASLSCLETEGYAGTTISKIVAKAKVSRGAHVHHFPSKAALIEAAARELVKRVYEQLGNGFATLGDKEDRLRAIAFLSWKMLSHSKEFTVFMELLQASRHDEELAEVMRRLSSAARQVVKGASEYYFETINPEDDATSLILLLHWQLSGMAMESHLLGSEERYEPYVEQLCELLSTRIKSKLGASGPPPRPPKWVF